ncbi:MAG: hypothetical protein RLZZ271_1666 [Pseudomonadota bacterium]|jgi:uncharacterized membrane protein YedE/YeeE
MDIGAGAILKPLIGGVLIGLASWLVLAALGRVTGISGIASSALMGEKGSEWRWAFIAGLVVGGALFAWLLQTPAQAMRSPVLLALAGLLVGFGTVWGSGCTSGHGVCGLGRLSARSLVSVIAFMATGVLLAVLSK